MKGIFQRLGFLIFAITLSVFIESAHHEDSLLEAINDQIGMRPMRQEILLDIHTKPFHFLKFLPQCMF